jgi:hypothetical protein
MFLRHQLLVLKRSAPPRLSLCTADRLIFVWLYRLCPSLLGAAIIFKPETLLRWHRRGFRLYWRWKSRRSVGRPKVPTEVRDLIHTISRDNPLWGANSVSPSPVDGCQVHVPTSPPTLDRLASVPAHAYGAHRSS